MTNWSSDDKFDRISERWRPKASRSKHVNRSAMSTMAGVRCARSSRTDGKHRHYVAVEIDQSIGRAVQRALVQFGFFFSALDRCALEIPSFFSSTLEISIISRRGNMRWRTAGEWAAQSRSMEMESPQSQLNTIILQIFADLISFRLFLGFAAAALRIDFPSFVYFLFIRLWLLVVAYFTQWNVNLRLQTNEKTKPEQVIVCEGDNCISSQWPHCMQCQWERIRFDSANFFLHRPGISIFLLIGLKCALSLCCVYSTINLNLEKRETTLTVWFFIVFQLSVNVSVPLLTDNVPPAPASIASRWHSILTFNIAFKSCHMLRCNPILLLSFFNIWISCACVRIEERKINKHEMNRESSWCQKLFVQISLLTSFKAATMPSCSLICSVSAVFSVNFVETFPSSSSWAFCSNILCRVCTVYA